MKYMGGKSKIAKEIVPIIQRHIETQGTGKYVEPFVGGANIIDKVECESRVGLDINRYLIALFTTSKAAANCRRPSRGRNIPRCARRGINIRIGMLGAWVSLQATTGGFLMAGIPAP